MSGEEVMKLLDSYDKDILEIKKSAISLAWSSRGSISYNDILNMNDAERKLVHEQFLENIETAKKLQMDFF